MNQVSLSNEDEKHITSLVIAYYNSAIEFDFMEDKIESNKFYKIAHELSWKELGADSFLSHTLSERVNKQKPNFLAPSNRSVKDFHCKDIKR